MNTPSGFDRELGAGGLEVRTIGVEGSQTRAVGDDQELRIEGLSSVYEVRTTISGWFMDWDEEVARGAWGNTITQKAKSDVDDIRCMYNHDINCLLGRQANGTLNLEDRDEGLFYSVLINPDDPQAKSVHAKVLRGDVKGASVWFRVISDQWTEPTEQNGLERPLRRILEGELFENGPVAWPAFTQTSATARSMDGVLLAAGVTKANRRAAIASELLADPAGVEARLRDLLARQPDLRRSVCDTEPCDCRTADGAPAGPPRPHSGFASRNRHLELSRARW